MKRKTYQLAYIGIAALVLLAMVMVGCAKPAPTPKPTPTPTPTTTPTAAPSPTPPSKPWPKSVAIGSGTGTTYYAIAGGIAKMMEKYLGVSGIPSRTSGGEETARLIQKGELQMGFITPDVGYDAYRSIGAFEGQGPSKLRIFLQDFPLGYNLITLEGSGINSWADLKGKKGYWTGAGSSVMRILWKAHLKAYGLKDEDIKEKWPFDRSSEWVSALKTGKADFAVDCGFHPSGKFTELATTHPMKIINVDDAHLAKIKEEVPYVFAMRIPGGTYKTMPGDVQVAAFSVTVDCTSDLPDDFVYAVTKMIWTHFDEFKSYHPVCKLFSTEAVKRCGATAYHPGAIRYYKEIGVWTKDLDERQAKLLEILQKVKK